MYLYRRSGNQISLFVELIAKNVEGRHVITCGMCICRIVIRLCFLRNGSRHRVVRLAYSNRTVHGKIGQNPQRRERVINRHDEHLPRHSQSLRSLFLSATLRCRPWLDESPRQIDNTMFKVLDSYIQNVPEMLRPAGLNISLNFFQKIFDKKSSILKKFSYSSYKVDVLYI